MLNESQKLAQKKIHSFLLSDETRMCLTSPSGYGKSYLIDQIIKDLDDINKKATLLGGTHIKTHFVTATTNKAAAVLDRGVTTASLLKLVLKTDFKTGKQNLISTKKSEVIKNSLVFIDEASMVSTQLKRFVDKFLGESKVIYVGDDHQLLPPSDSTSPAFDAGYPSISLTEPMRQDPNSDLFKLCQQLRETVRTGQFRPIVAGSSIRRLDFTEIQEILADWYHADMAVEEARSITYRNTQAIGLNAYIRPLCGFSEEWEVGDLITARNMAKDTSGNNFTKVDATYTISEIIPDIGELLGVPYFKVNLDHGAYFFVADEPHVAKEAMDRYAKRQAWKEFYALKEGLLDMRSAYACTTHVSQGSTYDKVYVDLADLGRCHDPKVLARLLYVAVSRAKHEVVFNGRLPYKYGG